MRNILFLFIVCTIVLSGCAINPKSNDKNNSTPVLLTTKVWFDRTDDGSRAEAMTMELLVDSQAKLKSIGLGTIIGLVTPFLKSAIDHGYDALVNYVNSEKGKYSASYSGIGSTHICQDAQGKVSDSKLTLHLQHGTFDNKSNQIKFAMDFEAEFLTNHIRIKPTMLVFKKSSARKAKDDKDFAVKVELMTFAMNEEGAVTPKVFAAYDYKFIKVPVESSFDATALAHMESQYMSLPVASENKAVCYPIAAKVNVIETEDIPVLLDIIAKSTADAKTETTTQLKEVLKEILDELKEEDKE